MGARRRPVVSTVVLYVESSAVLTWLFDEPRTPAVLEALEAAATVVSSELTTIECARTIHRLAARGLITDAQAAAMLATYQAAAVQWDRLEIRERVTTIAASRFPVEPIRALDAIHLASAMVAREVWREVAVLSLDERVRANAARLGLGVTPEPG